LKIETSDSMRKEWTIALILLVLLAIAWAYLDTGTPPSGTRLSLKAGSSVTSIELRWQYTNRTITASNDCARVIQVMSEARQCPIPASPAFGLLTIHHADGTTNLFHLQPSGRFSALELVNEPNGYAISMNKMIGVFESVGLLAKDRK
jgi:hypothetical protein